MKMNFSFGLLLLTFILCINFVFSKASYENVEFEHSPSERSKKAVQNDNNINLSHDLINRKARNSDDILKNLTSSLLDSGSTLHLLLLMQSLIGDSAEALMNQSYSKLII